MTETTPPLAARRPRLPYLPGLDGLRALAVIAVLLYHGDVRWAAGGFLGVEVFFVISGYLITALLLAEWRACGRIDLLAFWARRARRLLPGTFLLILTVLVFAVIWLPGEVANLRGVAAAAIAEVANWYLIISKQSYFQTMGRPSLLRHLWTLTVEWQFYLAWPLLLAFMLRRTSRRWTLAATLAAAAASTLLMALLYQPTADSSRIYYGTDTRAAGLLIGAALAFLWQADALPQRIARLQSKLVDGVGLLALGALAFILVRLDEFQPLLYQGGFAIVALTTALLIAAATHPQARLSARLLGGRLARWIGERSYGIYLWHWPVFMVTRPQLDLALSGWPLLALRIAVTFALAALSYRYVERPIQSGALSRLWNNWRQVRGWAALRLALSLGTLVILLATLGVHIASARPAERPSYLAVDAIRISAASQRQEPSPEPTTESAEATETPEPEPTPTATATAAAPIEVVEPTAAPETPQELPTEPPVTATATATTVATAIASPTRFPTLAPSELRITAVGDSVMLSAAHELTRTLGVMDLDVSIGRLPWTMADLLRERREANELGQIVIVHVGNNGILTTGDFDLIMQELKEARRVIWINCRVSRRWEEPNNKVLAESVKRYANSALVDWYAATQNRPELFWDDGIHVRPEGAQLYVELIADKLK
jgi:peptidoglycan/LPS O-acetylase OafA/YrhL